jgi:transcriptional regulator with XRE-family HTH domain
MCPDVPAIMEPMTSHEDRSRVGGYIERRRGALNLTREELADKAGVNAKTIYRLEREGRWPIARTRDKIERSLGWASGDMQRIAEGEEPTVIDNVRSIEDKAVEALFAAAGTPAFGAVAEDYITRMFPDEEERKIVKEIYQEFQETQERNQRMLGKTIAALVRGHRKDRDRNNGGGQSAAQ